MRMTIALGLLTLALACKDDQRRRAAKPTAGDAEALTWIGVYEEARIESARLQAQMLVKGVEVHIALHRAPPPDLGALVTERLIANERRLIDPWKERFEYRHRPDRSFTICSKGPDKVLGTGDDVCEDSE